MKQQSVASPAERLVSRPSFPLISFVHRPTADVDVVTKIARSTHYHIILSMRCVCKACGALSTISMDSVSRELADILLNSRLHIRLSDLVSRAPRSTCLICLVWTGIFAYKYGASPHVMMKIRKRYEQRSVIDSSIEVL